MNTNRKQVRKNPYYKGFFLFLPFLLSFGAVFCLIVVTLQTFVFSSPFFQLVVNGNVLDDSSSNKVPIVEEGKFPVIPYESQWATLNVEGWKNKDISVFFGDNNTILRKGAGMWVNSRFCGQNGKIVLSAHVTSYFFEMEDTKIGALVTMDTVYGQYIYKVVDSVVFHYQDASRISPQDGEEVLVLYTCYPRKNGYLFKTQRLALICKKIEGKDWTING